MSYVQTAGQVVTAVIVPPTAAVFVILFCLPVLFGGIALSWGAIKAVQRYRTVTAQSTGPIGSVTPGQTELEGRVRSIGETLEQPFTDGACVYARWKIEQREQSNEHEEWYERDWETLDSGRAAVPFIIEDDTGKIEVHDVTAADVDGKRTHRESGGISISKILDNLTSPREWLHRSPARVKAFLNGEVGDWHPDADPSLNTDNKFTQDVIAPGDRVYVLGQVVPKDDPAPMATGPELVRIAADETTDEFLVATGTEQDQIDTARQATIRYALVGGLLLLVSLFLIGDSIQALRAVA